jgi:hypothetical protein
MFSDQFRSLDNPKLFPTKMCGIWGDGFRCIRLSNCQSVDDPYGKSQIELLTSVYGKSNFSSIEINDENNTVYFVETTTSPTTGQTVSTNWKLKFLESEIVLCPTNYNHNMALLSNGQVDPHSIPLPGQKGPRPFTGWYCDVCRVGSNPQMKTPPPNKVERFFCGLCMADVCLSCASARKQYNLTLSGTAASSSGVKSIESLTLIPPEQAQQYCTTLSRQQMDLVAQLRLKAGQRAAKLNSAYTAAVEEAKKDSSSSSGGGSNSNSGNSSSSSSRKQPSLGIFESSRTSLGRGNDDFLLRLGNSSAFMLLASSGRHNFQDVTISKELLKSADSHDLTLSTSRASMSVMLQYEEKLRKSTSVQRLLTEFPECGEIIFSSLQYKVAKEIGFKDPKLGREAIRAAATLFPGDTALLHLASYRKYNRSKPGTLSVGDSFPDVPLYSLDMKVEGKEKLVQSSTFVPLPLSKHHEHLIHVSNETKSAS